MRCQVQHTLRREGGMSFRTATECGRFRHPWLRQFNIQSPPRRLTPADTQQIGNANDFPLCGYFVFLRSISGNPLLIVKFLCFFPLNYGNLGEINHNPPLTKS